MSNDRNQKKTAFLLFGNTILSHLKVNTLIVLNILKNDHFKIWKLNQKYDHLSNEFLLTFDLSNQNVF